MRSRSSREAEFVILAVIALGGLVYTANALLESGVLPWAFLGGIAAAFWALWISRNWITALYSGGAAAVTIAVLGIVSWQNPGWYKTLL